MNKLGRSCSCKANEVCENCAIVRIDNLETENAKLMSLKFMLKKLIAMDLLKGPGLEHLVNIVFPKPVGGGWEGCNPKIVGFTKEFEAVWGREL